MEKVKLTREQAEALSLMRLRHHLRNDKEALIEKHARGWSGDYKVLNEIDFVSFALLVLNGFSYVVELNVREESEFKPGDKVTPMELEFEEKRRILTLRKLKTNTKEEAWWYENHEWDYANDFRHATPEEVYWLETIGRDKINDFRKGDAVLDADGSLTRITTRYHIDQAISWYRDRSEELIGIYPDEAFKPFPKDAGK